MAREEHEHHPPHLSTGDVVGLVGLAALAFAIGRATSPSRDCQDRLQQAQMDLLLCQTKGASASPYGLPGG